MSSRLSVAIGSGTWRSVRMGSSSWAIVVGNARDFEDSAATRLRGGEKRLWRGGENLANPAPLEMAEPDFLLQFEIIAFDAPAQFRHVDEMGERHGLIQLSKARISSVLFRLLAIRSTAIPRESFLLPHRDRGPGAP